MELNVASIPLLSQRRMSKMAEGGREDGGRVKEAAFFAQTVHFNNRGEGHPSIDPTLLVPSLHLFASLFSSECWARPAR